MKKELVDLQPQLEQAKIDNTKMMKVNTFFISIQPHYDLERALSSRLMPRNTLNMIRYLSGDCSGVCRSRSQE